MTDIGALQFTIAIISYAILLGLVGLIFMGIIIKK